MWNGGKNIISATCAFFVFLLSLPLLRFKRGYKAGRRKKMRTRSVSTYGCLFYDRAVILLPGVDRR